MGEGPGPLGAQQRASVLAVLRRVVIGADHEGRVTCWNDAAESAYGWTQQEALGRTVAFLRVTVSSRARSEELLRVMLGGAPWTAGFTVERQDGTRFTALVSTTGVRDADGNLTGIQGVSTDLDQTLRPLMVDSASPAFAWQETGPALPRVIHLPDGSGSGRDATGSSGAWRWVEGLVSNLCDEPCVLGPVWTIRDTFDRHAELQEMTELALHDPLTGLPNRVTLLDRLSVATARREPHGALLFIDLDDFKEVNDRFGHAAGDALLKTVARRLEHLVRPEDACGRWAGDEFLVLNESLSRRTDALALAERLAAAIAQPVHIAGQVLRARASIGVAMLDGVHDPGELIALADEQMYRVKRDRRVSREG